jgi:hypothetical protein
MATIARVEVADKIIPNIVNLSLSAIAFFVRRSFNGGGSEGGLCPFFVSIYVSFIRPLRINPIYKYSILLTFCQ